MLKEGTVVWVTLSGHRIKGTITELFTEGELRYKILLEDGRSTVIAPDRSVDKYA